MTSNQSSAIETYHRLHESGCFVLPNPWDRGTARYLEHVGFKALATTSAGFAFSRGLPDGKNSLEAMLDHVRDISEATRLPVNADFQNGYADEPEDVAANISRCTATGVAGLSIEDSTGNEQSPLYEERLAVERVRAARKAIDDARVPVVLTARCEAFLVGDSSPLKVVLDRLVAFADAGADCLYAPGFLKVEEIEMIVRAVAPKPVNVLVSRPGMTVAQVADLGVRRISVGSALSRVAWAAFARATEQIANEGSFEAFKDVSASPDLNKIFGQ